MEKEIYEDDASWRHIYLLDYDLSKYKKALLVISVSRIIVLATIWLIIFYLTLYSRYVLYLSVPLVTYFTIEMFLFLQKVRIAKYLVSKGRDEYGKY